MPSIVLNLIPVFLTLVVEMFTHLNTTLLPYLFYELDTEISNRNSLMSQRLLRRTSSQ